MTAFIPVLCAILAVFLMAWTGSTERSLFGTVLEDWFYGFFLRSYPLFLFAVVYGVARILVAAAGEPASGKLVRLAASAVAVALFLAACFYPTFGGLVLRSGFATGGVGFLRGQSADAALVLGTAVSALSFAAVLGLCTALARVAIRLERRPIAQAVASVLALWAGALILQAPARFGFDLLDGFPLRPLGAWQALGVAGLVAAAALPHTLVTALRRD
jgi:hypothetical protein